MFSLYNVVYPAHGTWRTGETLIQPQLIWNPERRSIFFRTKRATAARFPANPTKSKKWWSQTGSNRRPHACKARALPAELWPQWGNSEGNAAQLGSEGDTQKLQEQVRSLVGLGRLELPTSRLSSARSNQLSYKPEPQSRKSEPAKGQPNLSPERSAKARPGRKRNEDGGVPHSGSD
jgi:hypothetical protein